MKKHFLKSFALLAMLFSALTLSAAEQYCHKEMTNGDKTIYVTGQSLGGDQYQLIIESDGEMGGLGGSFINVNGVGGYQLNKEGNFELSADKKTITCNITSTVPPTHYTPLYVLMPGEVNFGQPDIDYSQTCASSGDETPDTDSPVMTSASVVEGSITHNSVQIAVEATDNVKVASYFVKNGDVELGTFTAVNNNITVTGLEPSTTYQLTVFAKDAADNISAQGITVEVTTTSIPMSPFCDTEIGHEGNVNADPNSFILLSVGSDGAGHTIVTIRQDAAKNTSMFDYINIVGIKEIGSDIATGGSDAMGILFNTPTPDAEGNITFMIQWSIINWGGRWQYNVTLPAEAICANVDPYPSEPYLYCSYTDNNLNSGNANVALTWATDASGNVVIDIEDGEGASNSAFRNGGFELGGGLSFADSWKVYSGTNHQTVEDATVYFNEGGTLSNNDKRYTLTKKAEAVLPANAVIVWMGHAFSWKNDQAGGAYSLGKTFAYSYGESCPSLEIPTNVAVSEEGIITFIGSALAETYTASVYLGGILKYRQDVTNGGTLDFTPYVSGTYQVTVTASATGYPTTAPSEPFDWQRTVVPASPTNSAYCEQEMSNGNTLAKFTWETDDNGNIIITIAEALGGESSASVFRANAFNINNLRVGTHSLGSDYFTSSHNNGSVQTLTLKDPNVKPGIGEPITYNGIVEYRTSENQDAYPTLQFNDYLYGAKCEGQKRVTASVNDAAMGTAKVNGQDEVYVDPDTEVTFTATPNDGYVFVNWTKGDEVVSTSATYTTTITSALSLVANFDYARITYCQTPVQTSAGHTVYLTVGQAATPGKYQIKIEGSSEVTITDIIVSNTAMNFIKFTDINGTTYDGNDVYLTKENGGFTFSPEGYGVITSAEFEPRTGYTWKDMLLWGPYLFFKTNLAVEENLNDILNETTKDEESTQSHRHFDWSNSCEEDTEKPVMTSATLVSISYNSAIISVAATDNRVVTGYYVTATGIEQTLEPVDGKITVTDLTENTSYAFNIVAIDLAGNKSATPMTVTCTTQAYVAAPSSSPTAPAWPANQVKAVYSATYETDCGFANWSGDVQYTQEEYGKKYVNATAGYFGLVDFELNCSKMECLHIDVWAAEDFSMGIVPIHGAAEVRVTENITGGKWNSIDIPLTEFAGVPNWNNVYQIKIDQVSNKTFWLNNIYFYTTQAPTDVTPPTNITATATPAFETAVISCSAIDDSEIFFEVKLPRADGTYESKGTGKANSGKIANIVVANLQENREFKMLVFAKDEYGNEVEDPIEVTFTTNEYPEPAPTPMWAPENVKSIYSDSYTSAWASLNSYNEGWYLPPQILEATLTANNHALNYFNLIQDGVIGWQFASFDAKDYTTFTMDIYPINNGTIDFGPITEGVPEYVVTDISVKGKQWNTITIDLRGKDLTKIHQVKMANYQELGTFLIDNVYFYKMVIDENTDLTKLANGLECNVTLKRNFVMDNDWNTISLPFALTEEQVKEVFGEGTRITKLLSSELKSSTEIDIQFEDVTSIEAATPYLILPKKNVDLGTLIENITINVTPNILEAGITKMIPVLKTENFTGQDNTFFLGANDNLYNRSADGKIKGMRAYFQFSTLTPEQLRNVRARVVFNENVETSVDNLITDEAPVKMIQNGHLIIIRNGIKYNIQGQKL